VTDRDLKPANCQSCRAAIIWATTASGKPGPFEKDDDGIWTIVNGVARYVGGGKLRAPQGSLALEAPQHRYTSHFATCPDAARWRRVSE